LLLVAFLLVNGYLSLVLASVVQCDAVNCNITPSDNSRMKKVRGPLQGYGKSFAVTSKRTNAEFLK